mmetsp:Transcript_8345/g.20490  ORF Transcript_8345/g.20490 Transcript_8345/m.20490 type:complete len:858 (+) Transcript_8345:307-2880(+)
MKVENLTSPIIIKIPAGVGSSSTSQSLCRYWNATLGNWSTDGVVALSDTEDGTKMCMTTHLTSFNVEEKPAVSIQINTFSADDITADKFSFTNPVFVFVFSALMTYITLSFFACKKDKWNGCPCTIKRKATNVDDYKPANGGVVGPNAIHLTMMKSFVALESGDNPGKYDIEKDPLRSESLRFWRKMNQGRFQTLGGERSWKNFREHSNWSMIKGHPWISICCRHKGDHYSSFKRLTVIFTLVFNSMTVGFLLAGQEQQILFLSGVLATSIVSMALTLPVPNITSTLFGRQMPVLMAVTIGEGLPGSCYISLMLLMTVGCCSEDGYEGEGFEGGGEGGEEAADEDEAGAGEDAADAGEALEGKGHEHKDHHENGQDAQHNAAAIGAGVVAGNVVGQGLSADEKKRRAKENRMRTVHTANFQVIPETATKDANGNVVEIADSMLHNDRYTSKDYLGIAICWIVMLGCAFIVSILGAILRESDPKFAIVTACSLVEDAGARLFTMVIQEAILFAPIFACCAAAILGFFNCCKEDSEEEQLQKAENMFVSVDFSVRFHWGTVGFKFNDELFVTDVEQDSQASFNRIEVGLKIVSINGFQVHTGKEAYKRVQDAHRFHDYFEIGFLVPEGKEKGEFLAYLERQRSQLNGHPLPTLHGSFPALEGAVITEAQISGANQTEDQHVRGYIVSGFVGSERQRSFVQDTVGIESGLPSDFSKAALKSVVEEKRGHQSLGSLSSFAMSNANLLQHNRSSIRSYLSPTGADRILSPKASDRGGAMDFAPPDDKDDDSSSSEEDSGSSCSENENNWVEDRKAKAMDDDSVEDRKAKANDSANFSPPQIQQHASRRDILQMQMSQLSIHL